MYERRAGTVAQSVGGGGLRLPLRTHPGAGRFSFNSQKLNLRWQGFTLDWYKVLLADTRIQEAAVNSLVVAGAAATTATVLGTLLALALARYRLAQPAELLLYIAIIVPEVVLGIALLIWFSQLGIAAGLLTVAAGHVVLCTPFVALTVRARLAGYDRTLEEAAMDLGAREWTTFWRVTMPAIWPGCSGHCWPLRCRSTITCWRCLPLDRGDNIASAHLLDGALQHHAGDQRPFDGVGCWRESHPAGRTNVR